MNEYAGCVVLYKAEDSVIHNIESYYNEIDVLYVINNDINENDNIKQYCQDKINIKYYNLKKNYGIAFALNYGCKLAIKEGYKYILTMDQDSKFKIDSVNKMKKFMNENNQKYGIVGPNAYAMCFDENTNKDLVSYIEVDKDTEYDWLMTSGSIMNLEAYKKTSGFDDKMFIAHVDIEIGIQYRKLGYKIIKLKDAVLYQHFGNSKPKKFLFWTVHPSYDSPVRMYYLFRNQKYLKRKYPNNKNMIHIQLYKYIIKIICYENNKLKKLYMALKGYIDGSLNKMGPYK